MHNINLCFYVSVQGDMGLQAVAMEMGSVRPDVVNAISRKQYDGLRPAFTSGLVWTVPRMSSITCKFCAY
jgi:hypothetical protein